MRVFAFNTELIDHYSNVQSQGKVWFIVLVYFHRSIRNSYVTRVCVCVCVCARASALAVVFVVTIGLLLSLGAFLEIVFVTDCCFLLIIIIYRTM